MRRFPALAALALLLAGCGGTERPRSVVLVVVDTLRADHLGLYGYDRPTSPELDRRTEDGAVFERAWATSPWTLPSFGSLFTGRLPAEHLAGSEPRDTAADADPVARGFLGLRDGVPTLAETLAAHGLETAAVMNNAFLNPAFGVARGFQSYDHVAGNRKRIRRADAVVDAALEWASAAGRGDFLLVVHFFDPHLDYDPPEEAAGRWTASLEPDGERTMDLREVRRLIRQGEAVDWEWLTAAYDEEIAFVDRQIGRLLAGLEELGHLDDSLVALTADHGEELYDHGGFEHGHALFEEVLRIPLVIWGPGVEPGRYSEPASLIDLYPTVLDALGLTVPTGLPGRSLMPLLRGDGELPHRTLIAERTLYGSERRTALRWPYKLIHDPERGQRALFNLEEDPGETQGLARLREDITRHLLADLEAHDRHAETIVAGTAVEADEETMETLKSLGYVD